jgi:hypothetical protein
MNLSPHFHFRQRTMCFAAFALLFAFSGCQSTYKEDFREDVSEDDLSQFFERLGFSLPPQTEPIGIWKTYLPNESISLKALMTESEVDEMLKASQFQRNELLGAFEYNTDESEQANFPPNRLWWNPGTQDELRVSSKAAPGGGLISLGVLKGRGRKKSTVYITWDSLPPPRVE